MDAVEAAFHVTPREEFLPEGARARASYDGPIDIGHGQTSSQPRTVVAMLRLLDVQRGHRVLDVGSGSGWTTALLAELTGPTGEVVGVEVVPELVVRGAANLARTGRRWASIAQATEGVLGSPARAPYDRILVSAEARRLPGALVEQLAVGGRLVIPVAGTMLLVVRGTDATGDAMDDATDDATDDAMDDAMDDATDGAMRGVEVTEHGSYRFVPLV